MDLVVTPEQLALGYLLKPMPGGGVYYVLSYRVKRELPDGNFLVDYSHTVEECER